MKYICLIVKVDMIRLDMGNDRAIGFGMKGRISIESLFNKDHVFKVST